MNIKKISILLVVVIVLSGLGYFAFNIFKNKTPLSASSFKDKMEGLGYTVLNVTSTYEAGTVENVLVAKWGNNYQIEFIEVDTVSQAKKIYNQNKRNFEDSTNSKSSTELNGFNHSKYTQSSNGQYMVVSRIDKTVVYLKIDKQFKDLAKKALKEIGY